MLRLRVLIDCAPPRVGFWSLVEDEVVLSLGASREDAAVDDMVFVVLDLVLFVLLGLAGMENQRGSGFLLI